MIDMSKIVLIINVKRRVIINKYKLLLLYLATYLVVSSVWDAQLDV